MTRNLVISGYGDDLEAGMELARLIRSTGLRVEIGDTKEDPETGLDAVVAGECKGACALAFLGGAVRLAPYVDRIGLDPLDYRLIWTKPSGASIMSNLADTAFDVEDRISDQIAVGRFVQFLIEMGVSVELYARLAAASSVSLELTQEESFALGILSGETDYPPLALDYDSRRDALVVGAMSKFGRGKVEFYCDGPNLVYRRTLFVAGSNENGVYGCDASSCVGEGFAKSPEGVSDFVTSGQTAEAFEARFRIVAYTQLEQEIVAARAQGLRLEGIFFSPGKTDKEWLTSQTRLTEKDLELFPVFEFLVAPAAISELKTANGATLVPRLGSRISYDEMGTLAFEWDEPRKAQMFSLLEAECRRPR